MKTAFAALALFVAMNVLSSFSSAVEAIAVTLAQTRRQGASKTTR